MSSIRYQEMTAPPPGIGDRDAVAARIDPVRWVTLKFSLILGDDGDLEALRYARRAMIREERTTGLECGEPSMEQALFSVAVSRWSVLFALVVWCRSRIPALLAFARRA